MYKNVSGNKSSKKSKSITGYDIFRSSSEYGFTGPSSTWFNEDEYYQMLKVNVNRTGPTFYPSEINEMINDRIITLSYKAAIEINSDIFKDKIVLEIGSGIGLFSIFAAKAGAKHVYAVEEDTSKCEYSQQIIKDNQLNDVITVFKSNIKDIFLPCEAVDIIISNWMGYFLLQGALIEDLIYARDNWLKKDGIILPDKATLYVAAIEDEEYKSSKIDFWSNVYGINMDSLKTESLVNPLIEIFNPKSIISSVCPIYEINLYTVSLDDLNFSSSYELVFTTKSSKYAQASALAGWFDVSFDSLPNTIRFTTSPFNEQTKWRQTVFYLQKDVYVNTDDKLTGSIAVRRGLVNSSILDVKISFHFEKKKKPNAENFIQLYKIK